jgi:hypothetical protein
MLYAISAFNVLISALAAIYLLSTGGSAWLVALHSMCGWFIVADYSRNRN